MTTTYAHVGLTSTVATVTTSAGTSSNAVAHITDPAGTDLAEAALTHDAQGNPIYGAPAYLGRNGHGDVVFAADAAGSITGTRVNGPFGALLVSAGSIATTQACQRARQGNQSPIPASSQVRCLPPLGGIRCPPIVVSNGLRLCPRASEGRLEPAPDCGLNILETHLDLGDVAFPHAGRLLHGCPCPWPFVLDRTAATDADLPGRCCWIWKMPAIARSRAVPGIVG